MVRAKFTCTNKKDCDNGEPGGYVNMDPVSPSDPEKRENCIFGKYTPAGRIDMLILNAEAYKGFDVGQEYYVDFTPAQDKE